MDAAKTRIDAAAARADQKGGGRQSSAEADGSTALHWASYRDDLESVDLLIRAGANVNAANELGATPLWAASRMASTPAIVGRLLEAGANPNATLLRRDPVLMMAARSGNADVMEQLVCEGRRA